MLDSRTGITVPVMVLVLVCGAGAAYVIYQRWLHPLSTFPGPYLASVTDFWRFYHELRGDLPCVLHECHRRYGSIVRVAPNEVNTEDAGVIEVVYKKGGRHYPKSEFYNGFTATAVRPNVFGTQDEGLHALRRRQMAHAFSQASLVKMEYIFDRHVVALLEKLDARAVRGGGFRLETVLRFFSQDCNGDLSLGLQFDTQKRDDPDLLPRLNDHVALAKLTGYVPWLKPLFDRYGRLLPWPYIRRLLKTRAWMRKEAVRVTDIEFERVGRRKNNDVQDVEPGRFNLFTCLVRAKDPQTNEYIEREAVISNAMTFLTAGSHSTSSTLEIFFWYLLHRPEVATRIRFEIDAAYGSAMSNEDISPYLGMENKLPYLAAVFQECFRLSPTFQHPAPRVTPTNGPKYPTLIEGREIPPGYAISASVYSLHRNKSIWGLDADEFRPERWFDRETKEKEGLLMHFGSGHRACLGRNQSLIMLWKVVVEICRRFEIFPVDEIINEREPKLRVTGFAELAFPLNVKVSRRS